jgi:tetratricopeptide (TPR) repeat protein
VNRLRRTFAVVLAVLLLPTAAARGEELPAMVFRDWLGYNNMGWQAYNHGNDTRAAQAFKLAVDKLRPYASVEPELLARSYADYARVLLRQKRIDEAEPLVRWALSVRESHPGKKSALLRENLELLARVQRARRKLEDAEKLLTRLIALQESTLGAADAGLISSLETLADVYAEQGKLAQAEPAYRRALRLRDNLSDDLNKQAEEAERKAATTRQIMAAMQPNGMTSVNMSNQAERSASSARDLREKTAESLSSAGTTSSLASVLRRTGRAAEADDLDARAAAIRDAVETKAARARKAGN